MPGVSKYKKDGSASVISSFSYKLIKIQYNYIR